MIEDFAEVRRQEAELQGYKYVEYLDADGILLTHQNIWTEALKNKRVATSVNSNVKPDEIAYIRIDNDKYPVQLSYKRVGNMFNFIEITF